MKSRFYLTGAWLVNIATVAFLAGCTITRPVKELPVTPSFDVVLEEKTESVVRLRCTLVHPSRNTNVFVWSKETLIVKNEDTVMPYSFEFATQDMPSFESSIEDSMSPVTFRQETRRVSYRSQAVIKVFLPKDVNRLTVIYLGTNTLNSQTECVKELQVKSGA